VTSVTNDQTKVALSCKVHARFDLFPRSRHDDVLSVHALCATTRWVVRRHAGVVGFERPELGDGVVSSNIALASSSVFPGTVPHTAIAHLPSWLEYPHTSPHHRR